jgi:hypothetical protein
MSIPWVVLSSQDYLSQETISNHFNFCDALYNASHVYSQKKKNKSNKTKSFNNIQNQLSFKPQKPYNYSSLQEQVFNWFFNKTPFDRNHLNDAIIVRKISVK